MQGPGSRLRGLGTSALPPPALSLRYRVIRLPGPVATLSQAPLTTATSRGLLAAVNGLAKWQWPAVLATGVPLQLISHTACLQQLQGAAAGPCLLSVNSSGGSGGGVLRGYAACSSPAAPLCCPGIVCSYAGADGSSSRGGAATNAWAAPGAGGMDDSCLALHPGSQHE